MRILLILSFLGLTLFFLVVNIPFLYERDTPEPFGFFSDVISESAGLRYDSCQLDSIDDSTLESVDFYFGCTSRQLLSAGLGTGQRSDFFYAYYGNSGNVVDFENSLLLNSRPDYLVEFPFEVEDIGRAYRTRIYVTNGSAIRFENVNLTKWYAGHFNGQCNTLIVEWGDSPSITEFRFVVKGFFKQTSFEKKSMNYYVSNHWMRTPELVRNPPNSFVIKVKIPRTYDIENSESYDITDPRVMISPTIQRIL